MPYALRGVLAGRQALACAGAIPNAISVPRRAPPLLLVYARAQQCQPAMFFRGRTRWGAVPSVAVLVVVSFGVCVAKPFNIDDALVCLDRLSGDDTTKASVAQQVRALIKETGDGRLDNVHYTIYSQGTYDDITHHVNILMYAVLTGKTWLVELLTHVPGIDVDQVHPGFNFTPLHMAAALSSKPMVDLLKPLHREAPSSSSCLP
ncbi:Uncharacterized protein PBTT_01873 [Plasmodiophora brassicae]|uniref:Uncharacterized protein n=1 Tax=Plasmodiophora brassicae TaxID=37360 RepID=A0A0G4IMS5_PLABS|nr:hypothetical protein PBRA_005125 [Plasmodiophora brassicae]SPQ94575.1 unnamed protein product [Plasmodiophora brassicae]